MTRESLSDADVVEDVLAGRTDRFAILVERHEDSLFRHALALGIDPDAASDMVQDSLVRAWERIAECRDPARFRLWLGRILRNRCLDHLKQASTRYTVSLSALGNGADDPESGESGQPDTLFERRAFDAALDQALAAIPAEQSEAFVLKHVEGRSYDEMAELTGASISALKMRVHRARDEIRARLIAGGVDVTNSGAASS